MFSLKQDFCKVILFHKSHRSIALALFGAKLGRLSEPGRLLLDAGVVCTLRSADSPLAEGDSAGAVEGFGEGVGATTGGSIGVTLGGGV